MRMIDADARVTVQSFDIEHEEYDHTEMSVAEALDFATDEGYPAVVEAVPVAWFNKMIHSCGMQGEIGAVKALRWVLGAWKMTKDIWEDVNVGGADQRAGEADLREVQRGAGGRECELCDVPAELQALWRGHAADDVQGHHAL